MRHALFWACALLAAAAAAAAAVGAPPPPPRRLQNPPSPTATRSDSRTPTGTPSSSETPSVSTSPTCSGTPSRSRTPSQTGSNSATGSVTPSSSPTATHSAGASASATGTATASASAYPLSDAHVSVSIVFTGGRASVVAANATLGALLRGAVAALAGVDGSRVAIVSVYDAQSRTTTGVNASDGASVTTAASTTTAASAAASTSASAAPATATASAAPSSAASATTALSAAASATTAPSAPRRQLRQLQATVLPTQSPSPSSSLTATPSLTRPAAPDGTGFTVRLALAVRARAVLSDGGSGVDVVAAQAADADALRDALRAALSDGPRAAAALYGPARVVEGASGLPAGYVVGRFNASSLAVALPALRYTPRASPTPSPERLLSDGAVAGVVLAALTATGVLIATLAACRAVARERAATRRQHAEDAAAWDKAVPNQLAEAQRSGGGGGGCGGAGASPRFAAVTSAGGGRGGGGSGGGGGGYEATPVRRGLVPGFSFIIPQSRAGAAEAAQPGAAAAADAAGRAAPHARTRGSPALSPAAALRAQNIDPFAGPTIYRFTPAGQLANEDGGGADEQAEGAAAGGRGTQRGRGGVASPGRGGGGGGGGGVRGGGGEHFSVANPALRASRKGPLGGVGHAPTPAWGDRAGGDDAGFVADDREGEDDWRQPQPLDEGPTVGGPPTLRRARSLRDVAVGISALRALAKP